MRSATVSSVAIADTIIRLIRTDKVLVTNLVGSNITVANLRIFYDISAIIKDFLLSLHLSSIILWKILIQNNIQN